MQALPAFLNSLGSQIGDGSKDNTWKRLKRGDTPTTASGTPRQGVLSPSTEGSAFDKWPRMKENLEAKVAREKLEEVGGTSTWASISTQSSAACSVVTTSSCSPNTTLEDTDSATDSFSNFPKAAFRPYANGQRSVSPALNFKGHAAPVVSGPKVVPVKVLGGLPGKRGGQMGGSQQALADSDHCFRPVSAMDDNSDTKSIASTGTVVVQDVQEPSMPSVPSYEPHTAFREQPLTDGQMRRRSTSDVNVIMHKAYDPTPHSKTPPHTFSLSIRPLANGGDKATGSSKTPESGSRTALVPPSTNPPPLPVGAGDSTTTASSNTGSIGKGRSGSWYKRGSRRTSADSEVPTKSANSSGSDSNPAQKGKMGTSTTSLGSIVSSSRKESVHSLKLKKESKGAARYASANLDENTVPGGTTSAAVSTGYSPSLVSSSQQLTSTTFSSKASSPQQSLPDWTGKRGSTNRLSMVEMEPLPKSLTKDKGRRSKQLQQQQQSDTANKGTM